MQPYRTPQGVTVPRCLQLSRMFFKTPPLEEDIVGEQCLRRREIYLPQGVRQGRHQAQAKRCDGGVLHSAVCIELPPG